MVKGDIFQTAMPSVNASKTKIKTKSRKQKIYQLVYMQNCPLIFSSEIVCMYIKALSVRSIYIR